VSPLPSDRMLEQDGSMTSRPAPMPIDRRQFLRRIAAAGVALPSAAAVLAACERSESPPSRETPIVSSPMGPTFEAGKPAERTATLKVYEWRDYLSKGTIRSFEELFSDGDVRVEVESFTHMDEAVARLQDPTTDFDVFFPTIDALPGLIDAGLLRPLDHGELPNVRNVWSWFRKDDGPFYDPGQRFSLPYTVYVSGVAWRADMVDAADAPGEAVDPYGLFWNPEYRGRVGMYDGFLEAMSLALLRDGVTDVRAADDAQLAAAARALSDAVAIADVRFTNDGVEEGLAEGAFSAHQAWSGDVLSAPSYAAAEGDFHLAERLRFWSPGGPEKIVGCDLMAVCQRGAHPDLAHAFLNHLLDTRVGIENFCWNGYQPPLEGVTREAFAAPDSPWHMEVPRNLLDTLLDDRAFSDAQMLVGFGPSERARWLDYWKRVAPGT
jgi:spermidine/putrescine transport system substrate-binding protein